MFVHPERAVRDGIGLIYSEVFMRKLGELYFPQAENRELYKSRTIDGKRFHFRKIFLSKHEAEGAAAVHRQRGSLARVLPRTVVTHKYGYELGYDKVQGYILYARINQEK